MKFSIDVVFVDKNLKVKSVNTGLGPGTFVLPVWGASSVFELPAGTVTGGNIEVGDTLYVGN